MLFPNKTLGISLPWEACTHKKKAKTLLHCLCRNITVWGSEGNGHSWYGLKKITFRTVCPAQATPLWEKPREMKGIQRRATKEFSEREEIYEERFKRGNTDWPNND